MNDIFKQCKLCEVIQPLNIFVKNKKLLSGYENICKPCSNIRSLKNTKKRIDNRLKNPIILEDIENTTKKCGVCCIDKPFLDFNKNLKLKYGLEYSCRECSNHRMRNKYRPYRKEKDSEYRKLYISKNKIKLREYSKNYYELNKEKINEKSKEWRNNNIEYRKERDKQYRKSNKSLCNSHTHRRRAKIKNSLHVQNDSNIELIFHQMATRIKNCTGIDFHVDHILPLNKGGYHHHLNLQVIPGRINESKADKLDFIHPLLIHWKDLPIFLLDKIKL